MFRKEFGSTNEIILSYKKLISKYNKKRNIFTYFFNFLQK